MYNMYSIYIYNIYIYIHAEKHGLKIVLDDRFKEVQRGRWLGKTRDQINEVKKKKKGAIFFLQIP